MSDKCPKGLCGGLGAVEEDLWTKDKGWTYKIKPCPAGCPPLDPYKYLIRKNND